MRPLRLLLITGVLLVPARAALADGGTVTGHVTFTGTPPVQKPYAVPTAFAGCGTQVSMDRLVIGKNNGVANSVIYIEGLKKASAASATHDTVVADQKGCRYFPHVMAVTEGDAFTALNSDSTFHNVHIYFDANHSTVMNFAEPNKGTKMVEHVKRPGMYQLRCDVHPWMNAYVYVAGDGFATVTGADGSYKLAGVAPGTYKLVMWHEGWTTKVAGGRPEFSEAVQQTQEITVTAGQTTTANFSLK